jgi:hypothetical protein
MKARARRTATKTADKIGPGDTAGQSRFVTKSYKRADEQIKKRARSGLRAPGIEETCNQLD